MVKIKIDGTLYEVHPGRNLLQTCLALGFDIPYFCFHHALGSVGACRQCAVKKFANADDTRGKIVMSCMEPVAEGLIISTNDPEVKIFRAAVIESLMTNHPHDCPICDEGGECHLQDMTVMTGHDYRRFIFRKRTYNNQYLGPFINHEMNRCIQCYRCLRFYRDYAGGKDFSASGSANNVYFGRHNEGVLESEFSGNLVEVCPTGVFTDKTLKDHYARKWDLTNAPSVCVHCSLGCNTIVSERYGSVRRILSRYNGAVNGYFLCDRGRFGYEFLNNPARLKKAMVRNSRNSNLEELSGENYLSVLASAIKEKTLTGIGSPRASLESNFALESLVGKENFYHGITAERYNLHKTAVMILKDGPAHSPSMKEIEKSDAILILGEDLTNSAPMLALAIRQASRNRSLELATKTGVPLWNDAPVRELAQETRSPVFIAAPLGTKLDDLAEGKYNAAPDDIARFGFAVASTIDTSAPAPGGMDQSIKETAQKVATALLDAVNPLIITGLHCNNESIIHSASNIAKALSLKGKNPSLSIVFNECNSLGLDLIEGKSLNDLFEKPVKDEAETLIVLENDLYTRADKERIDNVFERFNKVIILDHLMNDTAKKADILLPSGTFAESTGTIVNSEGRAQRFYRVLPQNGNTKDAWKIISEMFEISGKDKHIKWERFDDIVASLTESYPFYNEKIARQTLRFSGRTAMNAAISVSEPKPPQDDDSPLAFSMEGYKGLSSSYLVPYYWSPGWNSVQAMNKYINEPESTVKEGNSGVLVFDEKGGSSLHFFEDIPDPFKPLSGKMLVVPVHLIFGSDELSSAARSVSELIPEPFILLNEREIRRLNLTLDDISVITVNKININVNIISDNTIPDGVAGLSLTSHTLYLNLPGWGIIKQNDTN
jgi:NADH-quinone oxidoreductase subunit G